MDRNKEGKRETEAEDEAKGAWRYQDSIREKARKAKESLSQFDVERVKSALPKVDLKDTFGKENTEKWIEMIPKIDTQSVKDVLKSETQRLKAALPSVDSGKWKERVETAKETILRVDIKAVTARIPNIDTRKLTDVIPSITTQQVKDALGKINVSAVRDALPDSDKVRQTMTWATSSFAAAFRQQKGERLSGEETGNAGQDSETIEKSGQSGEHDQKEGQSERQIDVTMNRAAAENEKLSEDSVMKAGKEVKESDFVSEELQQRSSGITEDQIGEEQSGSERRKSKVDVSEQPVSLDSGPMDTISGYFNHWGKIVSARCSSFSIDVEKSRKFIPKITVLVTNVIPKLYPSNRNWSLPKIDFQSFLSQLSQPSYIQRIIEDTAPKSGHFFPDSSSTFYEKFKSAYEFQKQRADNILRNDYFQPSYWFSNSKSVLISTLSSLQCSFHKSTYALSSSVLKVKQSAGKQFKDRIVIPVFRWFVRKKSKFLVFAGVGLFLYGFGTAAPTALTRYYLDVQRVRNENELRALHTELAVCRLGVEQWKKPILKVELETVNSTGGFPKKDEWGKYQFVQEAIKPS